MTFDCAFVVIMGWLAGILRSMWSLWSGWSPSWRWPTWPRRMCPASTPASSSSCSQPGRTGCPWCSPLLVSEHSSFTWINQALLKNSWASAFVRFVFSLVILYVWVLKWTNCCYKLYCESGSWFVWNWIQSFLIGSGIFYFRFGSS